MKKLTKAQAKEYIQKALDGIPELKQLTSQSMEFRKWIRDTRIATSNIFGENSTQADEFRSIKYADTDVRRNPMVWVTPDTAYQRGLDSASALLSSMITEIDRWWPDNVQAPPAVEREE